MTISSVSGGLASAALHALGGARRAEQSLSATAQAVARPGAGAGTGLAPPPDRLPGLAAQARDAAPEDPAAQQVALIAAQRSYEANLAVLRSVDQMSQRLLDTMG
ncbi:flagellar basal body rod C-terminal domain-containing protein [Pseudoroseomonas cervicalis]|uniref:flagellar basal body rod C-terminal domain-containing protein n=1 Tax=Teichococcus cervicalis TaxID=204525 RepID=UPI0022F18D2E|nr:flagellar basal body rod C-terminal domain-containing protein [Pseudoroseomonas cervicalis]WBV44269.1 hypothetical protein PFY06_06850 [Pseudoroseomonas cervicalis]